MTKLTDTQAILLSAAAQRSDGNLLPLPGSLRGGAAVKVVVALLSRGLASEEVIDRSIPADSALNTVWRNEADSRAVLLKITPEGLAAIGVEPAAEPAAPAETEVQPAGGAVDYRLNEGTNSAGEPAAGPATATPDAPKKRGRPKKAVEPAAAPTEEPKRRDRPKKSAAEPTPAAPRRTRDDTKQAQLIAMLRRKEGATIAQIVAATGWQPHTVRGAFAGALKKKLGLTVTSDKVEGSARIYRLAD
jgi:outer membrane biosynthesis protein TonB